MSLTPSPELNLDASKKPAKALLALPLVRSLGEQTLENPVMLSNLVCSVGCYNLHDVSCRLTTKLRHRRGKGCPDEAEEQRISLAARI